MTGNTIQSILIANRGEIACRIIETCRRLGIRTIAVYSDADAAARHVRLADEAHRLGAAETAHSYLNQKQLLALIDSIQPDALHPGYGFLSENAQFVRELEKRSCRFLGPSSKVIHAMGDKIEAKKIAAAAKAPLVPGMFCEGNSSKVLSDIKAFTKKEGLPIIIKAAAGGGGRGMRKVRSLDVLEESVAAAKREAAAFFGNDAVFVEKLIEGARHIEVQIIGDSYGKVLALGDRDCSFQRFHQKVIEEAPAPFLNEETRRTLHEAAIGLGKQAGYQGAGTVEFLVDDQEQCFFLEVNSRLQVEHPVTELIYGVDIVEAQIEIAQGRSLDEIFPGPLEATGHAIEVRLCAEKPQDNFIAATGTFACFDIAEASVPGCRTRLDSGVTKGDRISHYYDSMIAKCMAHAENRETARLGLIDALSSSLLAGVENNLGFLLHLLNHQSFCDGSHTIHTIDQEGPQDVDSCFLAGLAALCELVSSQKSSLGLHSFELASPSHEFQRSYKIDDTVHTLSIRHSGEQQFVFSSEKTNVTIQLLSVDGDCLSYSSQGLRKQCRFLRLHDALWISGAHGVSKVTPWHPVLKTSTTSKAKHSGSISSPLPGKVLNVHVSEGDSVTAGEVLITIESMKMEHTITAEAAGKVQQVLVNAESILESNKVLIVLDYD